MARDQQIISLGIVEARKRLPKLVRDTYATIVIERAGKPIAIYRPLTVAEEQEVTRNPDIPTVTVKQVIGAFRRMREWIAERGGQAIVCRIAPEGFVNGQQQSSEEVLGVISILTPNQIDRLSRRDFDANQIRTFARLKSANPAR